MGSDVFRYCGDHIHVAIADLRETPLRWEADCYLCGVLVPMSAARPVAVCDDHH